LEITLDENTFIAVIEEAEFEPAQEGGKNTPLATVGA